MKNKGVGLIGYGRFGRLAARYCAREADVHAYDPHVRVRGGGRIRRATLADAAAQPVVVLAVPISELPGVLRSIRTLVRPGGLVVDVCSVKVFPLGWMKRMLPPSVSIVGMHPLFGPDSDTGTLRGQRLVVSPSRGGKRWMGRIRALARSHGVRLHVMTPDAHDRLMAETLLITQYVGRLLRGAGIPERAWSTASYGHLRLVVRSALRDSEQLFIDMWRYNPYGGRTARALLGSHRTLLRKTRGAIDI
jgi:prephenate dehydrogenase